MKKVLYFIAVVLITTGCATGYYAPHNVNQFGAQTHVVLDKPNFRIVKNIEVVIDVNNTNLKRADVEKSAYAELLRRANLTGTQALINVVIEEVRREKKTWGVPKITQHVAARATVIEFVDGSAYSTTSATYQGSAPRLSSNSSTTTFESEQTSEGNAAIDSNNQNEQQVSEQLKVKSQIEINSKWNKYTKNIATRINAGEFVDEIYDINKNGTIDADDLTIINKISSQAKKTYSNTKSIDKEVRRLIQSLK